MAGREYSDVDVYFNVKDHISMMFYHDNITAYYSIPDEQTVSQLQKDGYKIAIFNKYGNNVSIPDYIIQNKEVIVINKDQW